MGYMWGWLFELMTWLLSGFIVDKLNMSDWGRWMGVTIVKMGKMKVWLNKWRSLKESSGLILAMFPRWMKHGWRSIVIEWSNMIISSSFAMWLTWVNKLINGCGEGVWSIMQKFTLSGRKGTNIVIQTISRANISRTRQIIAKNHWVIDMTYL